MTRELEWEEISRLQKASLFSLENYENFFRKSLEIKSPIIDIWGDTRVVVPIEQKEVIQEQINRDFIQEFKDQYKERFGLKKEFFSLVAVLKDSPDPLGNIHKSGRKLTKEIGNNPDLGEGVVLLYSQVKNSYVIPKSYIILSVDPYDFIMMGTGRGWGTCYSPMSSHYTGGYSLANDKNSFLVYITTNIENPIAMNKNKLHRRLGVLNDDFSGATLSTQYPYKNQRFEESAIHLIQSSFSTIGNDAKIEEDKAIKIYKTVSSQIYNDFTMAINGRKSHLYIGKDISDDTLIHYGSRFKCIRCGENQASDDMPICVDCELEVIGDNWEKFQEGENGCSMT